MDEACENRYPVNEKGDAIIDWGIVIPGQQKTRIVYARNESLDRTTLRQPYTGDDALKIIDYPTNLIHKQVGPIKLQLTPNKERIDAIHSDWGFDLIIG